MRMWRRMILYHHCCRLKPLKFKQTFKTSSPRCCSCLIFDPNFPGLACCDNVDIFTDLFSLWCWWRKSLPPWGLIVAGEGAKAVNYCDTESLQTLQSYVLPGHRHQVTSKPSHWPTWMSRASDWPPNVFLLSSLKSEPNIGTLLAQLPDSLKVMSWIPDLTDQWTISVWTFWNPPVTCVQIFRQHV